MLEVVFTEQLHMTPHGVSPGGAVFDLGDLDSWDLKNNLIVLRPDFEVWINCSISNDIFLFKSPAPRTPEIYVHKSLIKRIRNLENDVQLYPEFKTA
ncbi:MAG: hypothetical protein HZB99_02165 [Candidatus Harrisonbacteria bacterium]|nr:hypothetical protein [Candidatus Harrisonbacteria bacterium]